MEDLTLWQVVQNTALAFFMQRLQSVKSFLYYGRKNTDY
jgi:hypothetical protein